jgi:hypothetical protein
VGVGQPARGLVHETAVGDSVDWYTPIEFFERLGMKFDTDPCAGRTPAALLSNNVVPAGIYYTAAVDGLSKPWHGRAFVNPPYGPAMPRWMQKLRAHGNGVALVFARTETRWAQDHLKTADLVVFMRDRLYFVREDGFKGRAGVGSMLLVYGKENVDSVLKADLGVAFRR